jgi:hypothetical protein
MRGRSFQILAFAALLLTARAAVADNPAMPQNEGWALEITEKEFDRPSGRLRVQVRNTHERETVTAFGVVAVYDAGDGRGSTRMKAKDILLGTGIAPGGMEEVTFRVLSEGESAGEVGSKYAATKIALHYEILSDTASHGSDRDHIDQIFLKRAIHLEEAQNALARVRAARRDAKRTLSSREFWADFWLDEAQRREEASNFVGMTTYSKWKIEDQRQIAIHSYAELSRQMERRIAEGAPLEDTLDTLEQVLEEIYVKAYSAGVRPQDLERLREAQAGGGR